jgi:hypothetical protein
MTTSLTSVAEITTTAITLLSREIGAVNTARFLNQFNTGFGNYTEERDQVIGDATVDDLVAEIKQRRERGKRGTKPIRDPSRPTRH